MAAEVCIGTAISVWALLYFFICPFGHIIGKLVDGDVSGNLYSVDGSSVEFTTPMLVAKAFAIFIYSFPLAVCFALGCCERDTEKNKTTTNVLVGIFICSAIIRPMSYVIFFEVIGRAIGVSWSNLTVDATLLLLFDSLTASVFLMIIIFCLVAWIFGLNDTGRGVLHRDSTRTKGLSPSANRKNLRTVKYKKRFNPYSKRIYYNEASLLADTLAEPTINYDVGIKDLMKSLWEPEKVGIGKDAKSLRHNTICIVKIDYIGNSETLNAYNERRRKLNTLALTYSKTGSFYSLVDYGNNTRDIATRLQCPQLDVSVDNRLNECYLFHGTPMENITSIAREGFRLPKLARMLGSGIYFTDSPVKADQYAGRGGTGVIILSRVLLGNAAITNTARAYNVDDMNGGSVRKMLCCFSRKELPNHSIIYDGGLFREYVVYESCQTFPEFAIYYNRENAGTLV